MNESNRAIESKKAIEAIRKQFPLLTITMCKYFNGKYYFCFKNDDGPWSYCVDPSSFEVFLTDYNAIFEDLEGFEAAEQIEI